MRLILWIAFVFLLQSAQAQTVTVKNLSAPFTTLEVGNWVEVEIINAAPNGLVEVIYPGQPPAPLGNTNASGYFYLTAQEGTQHVGIHNQTWTVNGVTVSPVNPDMSYFPYAPRLPEVIVEANHVGSLCAPSSTNQSVCGSSTSGRRWLWSPVTIWPYTSYVSQSAADSASNKWNAIQSRIDFSNNWGSRQDVSLFTDISIGSRLAITFTRGSDCSTCTGFKLDCPSGVCVTDDAVQSVAVFLNSTRINANATLQGLPQSTVLARVLEHELGHALRISESTTTSIANGTCSQVQSIMYPSLSVLLGCGASGPTTSCDTGSINTRYPISPPICPASTFPPPACFGVPC